MAPILIQPRINDTDDIKCLVAAQQRRHAQALEHGGSHENVEFLAGGIVETILVHGPQTAATWHGEFIPTFSPGWSAATSHYANSASDLIEPCVSVVLFHALGLNPGIPIADLRPLMDAVSENELCRPVTVKHHIYGLLCLLIGDEPRRWDRLGSLRENLAPTPPPPRILITPKRPKRSLQFNGQAVIRNLRLAIPRLLGWVFWSCIDLLTAAIDLLTVAPPRPNLLDSLLDRLYPSTFVPGETLLPGEHGIIYYLVLAMQQGATLADVLPAYHAYLTNFEGHFHNGYASPESLFLVAAIVYHRIGGCALTEVPGKLYEDHLRTKSVIERTGVKFQTSGLATEMTQELLQAGKLPTARGSQHLRVFTPCWRVALTCSADNTSQLIEPATSVMIFHALGLDPNISIAELTVLMSRVDIREIDKMLPYERWRFGFLCILIDEPRGWQEVGRVLRQNPLPPFEPHQTFGLNSQGLIRYLAAAVEAKAPLEAVLPAYHNYLANYEALFDAVETSLECKFLIAAIVLHRIGGRSLDSVPYVFYCPQCQASCGFRVPLGNVLPHATLRTSSVALPSQRVLQLSEGSRTPTAEDAARRLAQEPATEETCKQDLARVRLYRAQLDTDLAKQNAPTGGYRLEVLAPEVFDRRMGISGSDGKTEISADGIVVYIRRDADADVISHEAKHVAQLVSRP